MDTRGAHAWQRQRREWEMHQDRQRFELLDSDEDDYDEAYGPHDDLAYGDDYNGDDYADELSYERDDGVGAQLALRQKEEELAERAMRRIRRARLKGESSVDLTREELDALEKRGQRQRVAQVPLGQQTVPAAIEAPAARPASSSKQPPARKGKGKAPTKPGAKTGKASKSSKAVVAVPIDEHEEPESPPGMDAARSRYSTRSGSSSPVVTRASSRTAMRPQSSHYEVGYRPGSSGSMRRRMDTSPTRSLPDDPDWVPTTRPRSSSQLYKGHSQASGQGEAVAYQVGGPGYGQQGSRRIVSDPAQHVSYSNLRRSMGPVGASRSGLVREVVEVGPEDQDDVEDDESDEGVRVDAQAAEAMGYRTPNVVRPPAGMRSRRGRW